MGTNIATIKKSGRKEVELSIGQFAGPKGLMLQLTQGFGGCSSMQPLDKDEPGYIQLTEDNAVELIDVLTTWLSRDKYWYFTFGCGQVYEGRYVRIYGSYDSAREEMCRRFQLKWSMQYGSAEKAGVERWGYKELC